ncbi:hypothetical protein C2E23DRAFT_825566 [Lenzites betulinus]|nr:hypothetical protein C2E23DRAFT_825566 [Lenzites betulinus]
MHGIGVLGHARQVPSSTPWPASTRMQVPKYAHSDSSATRIATSAPRAQLWARLPYSALDPHRIICGVALCCFGHCHRTRSRLCARTEPDVGVALQYDLMYETLSLVRRVCSGLPRSASTDEIGRYFATQYKGLVFPVRPGFGPTIIQTRRSNKTYQVLRTRRRTRSTDNSAPSAVRPPARGPAPPRPRADCTHPSRHPQDFRRYDRDAAHRSRLVKMRVPGFRARKKVSNKGGGLQQEQRKIAPGEHVCAA